ncbi:F-box protein PP2-A13-like isoform X2 [Wolffia australiana]
MGAGVSSMVGPEAEAIGLGDLPEACVAAVLCHLDPPAICGVARLNRAFRGAASADFVWEPKLPGNFSYLLEKIASQEPVRKGISKKEIFARLCRPNPFDGDSKLLWLDKRHGGLCLSISSKALSITGIDDRRYWTHIPTDESRHGTVAYLQQIWWLEVEGELEFWFPEGDYNVFFRLQLGRTSRRLGRRVCHSNDVHGWEAKPVQFQLAGGVPLCYYLREPGSWVLYRAGGFTASGKAGRLAFSMRQIDCTHTKGGLSLDSILICPANLKPLNGRCLTQQ